MSSLRISGPLQTRFITPFTHFIPAATGLTGLDAYTYHDTDILCGVPGQTVALGLSLHTSQALSGVRCEIAAPFATDARVIKVWWQPRYGWYSFGVESAVKTLQPTLLLHDDSLVSVDLANQSHTVAGVVKSDRTIPSPYVRPTHADFQVKDAASLQPFNMAADDLRNLLIEWSIPANAAQGTYLCTIHLHVRGLRTIRYLVPVRVLPFKFATTTRQFGVYMEQAMDTTLTDTTTPVGGTTVSEGHLRATLQACVAHGLNPTVYNRIGTVGSTQRTNFIRHLELRHAAGLSSLPLYCLGEGAVFSPSPGDATSKAVFKAQCQALKAITDTFGIPRVYVYGRDENVAALAGDEILFEGAHEAGCHTMVATNLTGYGSMPRPWKLDQAVVSQAITAQQVDQWHSVGSRVLKYATPQGRVNSPAIFRRNCGWMVWALGLDGYLHWSLSRYYNDPWNNFDHAAYAEECLVFPDAGPSVIPTLALKGYREGIYDVRYLETLETLIATYPGVNPDAELFLADLRVVLQAEWPGTDTHLQKPWHSYRQQVIRYIESYQLEGVLW